MNVFELSRRLVHENNNYYLYFVNNLFLVDLIHNHGDIMTTTTTTTVTTTKQWPCQHQGRQKNGAGEAVGAGRAEAACSYI